jgi:hypothetical protein
LAALAFTLLIVLLQQAWNLPSSSYLVAVAERANTSAAIAEILPEYAATKLPNEAATKQAFTQFATPAAINESITSLSTSINQAYMGKTDVVEVDITPITTPVRGSGYEIPPGTVFASDTVQVGGLASILRMMQRALFPSLIMTVALIMITMLLGIKRGLMVSLRSVLLVTSLLLSGLVLATLLAPMLITSLVSTSGLDAGLRDVVIDYITVILGDAGRYYIGWTVVLLVGALLVTIGIGMMRRARRPRKHTKDHKPPPQEPRPRDKEL